MSENSRVEGILQATIDGDEYTDIPQSRVEELLVELKEVIEEGGGGGGTTVVPNPSGEATEELETIQIGNTIYDIPGSGGGGCNSYSNELIYDTYTTANGTYSLSKSIDNYDALLICGYGYASDDPASMIVSQYVTKDEYGKYMALIATVSGGTRRMTLNFPDSTHITISAVEGSIALKYIYGLKFGGMLAPMIYSLEEREVGVWVDDKPLYQRTFDKRSLYLADNTWSNKILGTTGIHIVNYEGYFCLGADAEPTISYSYYRSSSEYFTATIDTSYSDITVRPNMNYGAIYAGLITIWYTKDSDVPGSGSYGSLGVPMVHYDNTEKVVGTYFGKTLYEKSYQNVAGKGQSVDVTLSDLTDIETIFIVPEASASTDDIPFPYVHYNTSNIIGGFFTIRNGVPTLSIRRGSDLARMNIGLKYLTVRYTKTTD